LDTREREAELSARIDLRSEIGHEREREAYHVEAWIHARERERERGEGERRERETTGYELLTVARWQA